MRYYPAVLSKFACATSKNFKQISFLCAWIIHSATGGSWYLPCSAGYSQDGCLFTHDCMRKGAVIGIPSPKLQKEFINNQTKTPMEQKPLLYRLGTATNLSSMEDIDN